MFGVRVLRKGNAHLVGVERAGLVRRAAAIAHVPRRAGDGAAQEVEVDDARSSREAVVDGHACRHVVCGCGQGKKKGEKDGG